MPEEEIAYGPAAWLWDYLRRSGACGFLLPLSGGADSSSTAAIVGVMCNMVMDAVQSGDERVRDDALRCAPCGGANTDLQTSLQVVLCTTARIRANAHSSVLHESETFGMGCAKACRIGGYDEGAQIASAQELAGRVFTSVYMGTDNSSAQTRKRSGRLAEEIGCTHIDADVDGAVAAVVTLFTTITGAHQLHDQLLAASALSKALKGSASFQLQQVAKRRAKGRTGMCTRLVQGPFSKTGIPLKLLKSDRGDPAGLAAGRRESPSSFQNQGGPPKYFSRRKRRMCCMMSSKYNKQSSSLQVTHQICSSDRRCPCDR